jgi:addiction module HigA family antidote
MIRSFRNRGTEDVFNGRDTKAARSAERNLMIRIPPNVRRSDFGVSQSELARRIGVPFQRVNDVVHARRAVTASTALRLARFFGNSAQFWMNAQVACDLYETEQRERDELERIEPVSGG